MEYRVHCYKPYKLYKPYKGSIIIQNQAHACQFIVMSRGIMDLGLYFPTQGDDIQFSQFPVEGEARRKVDIIFKSSSASDAFSCSYSMKVCLASSTSSDVSRFLVSTTAFQIRSVMQYLRSTNSRKKIARESALLFCFTIFRSSISRSSAFAKGTFKPFLYIFYIYLKKKRNSNLYLLISL